MSTVSTTAAPVRKMKRKKIIKPIKETFSTWNTKI